MNGFLLNGKIQNVESVDTTVIRDELNNLTVQETNIQNRIDNHITEYLDCIRRKI